MDPRYEDRNSSVTNINITQKTVIFNAPGGHGGSGGGGGGGGIGGCSCDKDTKTTATATATNTTATKAMFEAPAAAQRAAITW